MGNFVDDNHALKAGYVWGVLMKAGIPAYPEVDDKGDSLPLIHLRLDAGDPQPVDVIIEVKP